eukprot:TRINITY_DN522_c0_g2_i4.p1 TRINITY_DN522_c0_g2~~TRINITY_DN522_c0_g2_i4.p1  ORF type:complete len:647 (+),score=248.51 TRINITY_DN522_c0_g2_i4:80-1942(+)
MNDSKAEEFKFERKVVVATVPASHINGWKAGVNLFTDNETKNRVIVFKKAEANGTFSYVACRNVCRHNAGSFVRDIEDSPIVTCSYHGWKLDCSTLNYVDPPDCLKQDGLLVEPQPDGSINFCELEQVHPWEVDPRPRLAIQPGELTVTYLSHACVEIRAGPYSLITDPWLLGPSFGRGWWLIHEPPADSFERLARANAIYISHSHPDHCNFPTLQKLAGINPNVPIYVANISKPVIKPEFDVLGLTGVNVVPLNTWINLSPDGTTRFMILPDKLYPHLDTCLLLEHKGHTILNLVDCCNPNGDVLPDGVDVLLTDFASGASGFPSCFADGFGADGVVHRAKEKAATFLKKATKHVSLTKSKVWIPFAGYFTEAHPEDREIQILNQKNSPQHAAQVIGNRVPNFNYWLPFPGGSFDVASNTGDKPDRPLEQYVKTSWEFEPYVSDLKKSLNFTPLQYLEGVQFYYDWAGFCHYDLLLHVQEFDDAFQNKYTEYYVDFRPQDRAVVTKQRPAGECPYFRVRARASVMRDIMIRGWSWDNIYIGFSGRFLAQPEVYHFKFWDHFNNRLPDQSPVWAKFIVPARPADCQSIVLNKQPASSSSSSYLLFVVLAALLLAALYFRS